MAHWVEMFDVPARRVLQVTLAARRQTSRHRFGGPAKHQRILPSGCERPLVLLYDFDLGDPVLSFLRIPGVARLPLYYPFFQEPAAGYRVASDTKIQILTGEHEDWDHLPPDGPVHYSERPVEVQDLGLSPNDPDALIGYSGVFRLATLPRAELAAMRPHLEEVYRKVAFRDDPPESLPLEELVEEVDGLPFWQGAPKDSCPDPHCVNHEIPGSMEVFLLVRDAGLGRGITLWGDFGNFIRLVFEICPVCRAILATGETT